MEERMERASFCPFAMLGSNVVVQCIGLAVLTTIATSFWHQRGFASATPVSRLDLLHAITSHGTLRIDAYHTNTPDKASKNGHFYSDKAPGAVVLALPSFFMASSVLRVMGEPPHSKRSWLVTSWVASAASNGLLSALGAAAAFASLRRWVSPRAALVTTLSIFLGAAPLPYASMMFSHSLVVGLLAVALWAMSNSAEQDNLTLQCGITGWLKVNRWSLVAGHACGWALASEYTAGIVVSALSVYFLSKCWRNAVAFFVGAVPPLALIPAYSLACFGDPLVLAYSLNESFPAMKEGVYAIGLPNPETAVKLLFSPARGLLFWSPFLLIALLGFAPLAARSKSTCGLVLGIVILQVVVISGRTWDWQAGATLGPRYLAPILPLLALPCALGAERLPRIAIGFGTYSILITTMATMTNACPAATYKSPLTELHIPLLLKRELSPNLGMAMGLPPYASVCVYYGLMSIGIWLLWQKTAYASDQGTRGKPTSEHSRH